MISQTVLAGIGKVLALGALIAGSAGGIYLVASTRGDDSQKQTVIAATATPPLASTTTAVASVTPASSPTALAGLTDTGYKAPDGSPLYTECIGANPITGAKLALPPDYPTPSASPPPEPTSSLAEPTVVRPPDADLPDFDVLSLQPSDASQWGRVSTPCVGGLSLAAPPSWTVTHPLTVGGYQQAASAMYVSGDSSIKIDITYNYDARDLIARRMNATAGNGTYFLVRNAPAAVDGAPGLVSVSSEAVESPQRYIAVSYLVWPRANWYLSLTAFVQKPFVSQDIADVLALINSVRFSP